MLPIHFMLSPWINSKPFDSAVLLVPDKRALKRPVESDRFTGSYFDKGVL